MANVGKHEEMSADQTKVDLSPRTVQETSSASARKTLLSCSDELLLEVVANVPFSQQNWQNLCLVCRRFQSVMSTKSLPARTLKKQYGMLVALLDLKCDGALTFEDLQYCHNLDEVSMRWVIMAGGDAKDDHLCKAAAVLEAVRSSKEVLSTNVQHGCGEVVAKSWAEVACMLFWVRIVNRVLSVETLIIIRHLLLKVYSSVPHDFEASGPSTASSTTDMFSDNPSDSGDRFKYFRDDMPAYSIYEISMVLAQPRGSIEEHQAVIVGNRMYLKYFAKVSALHLHLIRIRGRLTNLHEACYAGFNAVSARLSKLATPGERYEKAVSLNENCEADEAGNRMRDLSFSDRRADLIFTQLWNDCQNDVFLRDLVDSMNFGRIGQDLNECRREIEGLPYSEYEGRLIDEVTNLLELDRLSSAHS